MIRAVLLSFALLALMVPTAAGPAHARDEDCGDFPDQASAQRYFLDHGGPQADPDRLDADGDGVACEANPCPCSSDQGGGDGGGGGPGTPPDEPVTRDRARIVRVSDGDTVVVRLRPRGRQVRVRLLGVDTPEVYGGVECGGPAASRSARELLPRGTRVTLVSDPSQDRRDRYGRLLRYVVKRSSGVDVSRYQIREGRGTVYVYRRHPFLRVRGYRAAQRFARTHRLGIWETCARSSSAGRA